MIPRPHDDKFIVAGDWHGNLDQALKVVNIAKAQNIDTIIQVGDFGAYPTNLRFLAHLRHALESAQRPITLYFVDGNHEHHLWLNSFPINQQGLRPIRHNIIHIPRGYRWEWDNLSFMGLGGAPSIRKRIHDDPEKNDWWAEEALTQADVLYASSQAPVDVMFTHDSPITAHNTTATDQSYAISHFGSEAVRYCTEHRYKLAQVTNALTPRVLYHGHFHKYISTTFVHMNPQGTTAKAYGLDQGSAYSNSHKVTSLDKIRQTIRELDYHPKETRKNVK